LNIDFINNNWQSQLNFMTRFRGEDQGYVEGVTHDYERHGTTTFFAALDIATVQSTLHTNVCVMAQSNRDMVQSHNTTRHSTRDIQQCQRTH
jgi:hypothetical protein